jgi:hypothetical protein
MLNSFSTLIFKGHSMRIKLLLAMIGIYLLLGCSSTREDSLLASHQEKIEYHKNLQEIETASLKRGEKRVAMLMATYIFRPSIDKNNTRDEVFILSASFEDENSTLKFTHNENDRNEDYILTLNGKEAVKVMRLESDDMRLKDLSFVTEWTDYYEVVFQHRNAKQLNLKFENNLYGKAFLHFSKVAKFVHSKKIF